MLYKTCSKCNIKITYDKKYCDICQVIHDKETQLYKSIANKKYNKEARNQESNEFYHSMAWQILSEACKKRFVYIDIYSYYVEKKIIYGEISHHIIELTKDKSKGLDINNLIYLSIANHNKIHELYKKDYEGTKELLFNLVDRWKGEMKI